MLVVMLEVVFFVVKIVFRGKFLLMFFVIIMILGVMFVYLCVKSLFVWFMLYWILFRINRMFVLL